MNTSEYKKPQMGISLCCHRGHLPFLDACLESIRSFIPDWPICIFPDGIEISRETKKKYHVDVIYKKDIQSKRLAEHSYGFGFTKMVAFWEAPFEWILHMDVDTIMWGDVRKNFPLTEWDVLHNEAHEIITPKILREQYFCNKKVSSVLPQFNWTENPYFNTGVVCIKRNTLDQDLYFNLLAIQKTEPGVLGAGEQGILNLLVFHGKQLGKIKTQSTHLQTIVPVTSRERLLKQYGGDAFFPKAETPATIFHWAGKKPWILNPGHFPEPMLLFRRKALVSNRRKSRPLDLKLIFSEIKQHWAPKYVEYFLNRFRNLLKRLLLL